MQILEGLLKLPENKKCADCKAKYYLEEFKRDDLDIIRNFMARSPEETM